MKEKVINMKNKFSNLLMLLGLAVAVVGCGNGTPSSTSSESLDSSPSSSEVVDSSSIEESSSLDVSSPSSDSSMSSDSSSSSSSVIPDDEYNVLPNWEETTFDISIGGDMLDIAVGRSFMTGADYQLYYTMGSSLPSNPSGERAISSNEKVFTVTKESGGGLKVHAVHAGRAYLRIYDSNNIIRYCGLVVVEDPIPLADMEEYLVYDCEYWVTTMSWVDSFTIIFNEGGQYTVSGYLENVPFGSITGTYEYVETINNGKEYSYRFTDTDVAQIGLVGFDIASTGKFMYLIDKWGVAAILFPNNAM